MGKLKSFLVSLMISISLMRAGSVQSKEYAHVQATAATVEAGLNKSAAQKYVEVVGKNLGFKTPRELMVLLTELAVHSSKDEDEAFRKYCDSQFQCKKLVLRATVIEDKLTESTVGTGYSEFNNLMDQQGRQSPELHLVKILALSEKHDLMRDRKWYTQRRLTAHQLVVDKEFRSWTLQGLATPVFLNGDTAALLNLPEGWVLAVERTERTSSTDRKGKLKGKIFSSTVFIMRFWK